MSIVGNQTGMSPELDWTGAPAGTKSFAVVLQDLSNMTAHWILWNISATATMVPANVDKTTAMPAMPAGSQQVGKNNSIGFYGPGAPCNCYEALVYALSVDKFSPTMATNAEMVRTQLNALGASILGKASIRGKTNSGCD
jgi:Raf kinase inhibitor-like YbhB/YbcL family protein